MYWRNHLKSRYSLCKIALLSSISFISCYSNAASPAMPNVITIATQAWPPYQIENGDKQYGYAIEALECVMTSIKQDYRVEFVPWGRAQSGTALGTYDGFFSASKHTGRDEYAILSDTFIEQKWSFYLHKDSTLATDLNTLQTKAVFGSRKHSNTLFWLQDNGFKNIHKFNHVDDLVKLLVNRRIDAIMENEILFNNALYHADVKSDTFIKVDNIEKPLGVYFGKRFLNQYPSFLGKFNQATQQCRFSQDNNES
ncbi:transporter substrate-binding domain-containing protein [Shewanella sp. Scap07]|nr:transporter substrate-binding domain-containing protein [Shewanella sp. Scap07]